MFNAGDAPRLAAPRLDLRNSTQTAQGRQTRFLRGHASLPVCLDLRFEMVLEFFPEFLIGLGAAEESAKPDGQRGKQFLEQHFKPPSVSQCWKSPKKDGSSRKFLFRAA